MQGRVRPRPSAAPPVRLKGAMCLESVARPGSRLARCALFMSVASLPEGSLNCFVGAGNGVLCQTNQFLRAMPGAYAPAHRRAGYHLPPSGQAEPKPEADVEGRGPLRPRRRACARPRLPRPATGQRPRWEKSVSGERARGAAGQRLLNACSSKQRLWGALRPAAPGLDFLATLAPPSPSTPWLASGCP